jgi:tetratricopeptide (TPR) repeat protein
VLADAMDARIKNLGPGARSLGEVLAVRGGVASLATCVALSGGMNEAGVFEALDELGGRGVLLGGEGKFAFRHDALREALLRNLDPVQRRVLHRRIAEHLLARDAPSTDEAEVGWHLMHGGRAAEAAPLLHRAGRRLFESFSFPDSVPVLEAALAAYGEDAPPAAVLEVRKMLLGAAATCDRKLAARYAEETLVALRHWAGVDVAARLRGRRGLTLGLGVATSRWAASAISKKTPTPVRALSDFVAAVSYATVHRAGTLDLVRARSLAEELRPFESLDESLLGGAYLLARSVVDLPLGHFGRIRQTIPAVLRVLGRDRQLRDFERRLGTGLALYLRAMAAALDQLEEHEDDCRKIEALGPRFEVAAAVVRVAYRRGRGEETIARKLEREVEVMLAERGSGWTLESNVIWATVLGHALTRDVDGLRHAAEASARLHADGGCSLALSGLAEGEHLLARGNAAEAAIVLERALGDLPAEDRIFRATTHAALAETALATGDLESAIDRASSAMHTAGRDGDERRPAMIRARATLAVAHARLGDGATARSEIERAITDAETLGSPALGALARSAAAEIAITTRDPEALRHHRARAALWCRSTSNPALIGRLARLSDDPDTTTEDETKPTPDDDVATKVD